MTIWKCLFYGTGLALTFAFFTAPTLYISLASLPVMLLASLLIRKHASVTGLRKSKAEQRRLGLFIPLFVVVSVISSILLVLPEHDFYYIAMPMLIGSFSLFYFDTFNSALSYLGVRKPIMPNVRINYHFSLLLFHYAVGFLVTSSIYGLGLLEMNVNVDYVVALAHGFVGLIYLFLSWMLWTYYRKRHAYEERQALSLRGDGIYKYIKGEVDTLSALTREERERIC